MLKYILVILLFTSCITAKKVAKICETCPAKEISTTNTTKTDSIVPKKAIVDIEGGFRIDTVFIECPDGQKPILKSHNTKSSGNAPNTNVNTSSTDKGLLIEIKAVNEAKQAEIDYLEHYIKEIKETNTEKVIACPPLTWWEEFWIITGRILSVVLLIAVAYRISK